MFQEFNGVKHSHAEWMEHVGQVHSVAHQRMDISAPSKSGHISHSSLKKAHAKALGLSKVTPFLLYSLRHTFATRLALSPSMDAWTLCKIMGWSSLPVAMRYIHPSEERVLEAFGQKPELSETGDSATAAAQPAMLELAVTPTGVVV